MRAARPAGRWLALALLGLAPLAAQAEQTGTLVRGTVRVQERSLFSGLHPREDASGVLVYLTGFTAPGPDEKPTIAQRGKRFEPKLLPIVVGQSVLFPNFDSLYHNVFSVSPVTSFDLGQYRSTEPPRTVVFQKTGLVPVFCNIHPQMISYVVVLENPAFATTGPDGSFEIRGAPAGPVTLNAWTPGAPRVSQELVLVEGSRSEVVLELVATERIDSHSRKDGTPYPQPGTKNYR
jgi:plastocyanin